MVKRVDGSAFSNPTLNGLMSFKNPMVPAMNNFIGMGPLDMFWWMKKSQVNTYTPNRYGAKK